jgi:hypothetical protein
MAFKTKNGVPIFSFGTAFLKDLFLEILYFRLFLLEPNLTSNPSQPYARNGLTFFVV